MAWLCGWWCFCVWVSQVVGWGGLFLRVFMQFCLFVLCWSAFCVVVGLVFVLLGVVFSRGFACLGLLGLHI